MHPQPASPVPVAIALGSSLSCRGTWEALSMCTVTCVFLPRFHFFLLCRESLSSPSLSLVPQLGCRPPGPARRASVFLPTGLRARGAAAPASPSGELPNPRRPGLLDAIFSPTGDAPPWSTAASPPGSSVLSRGGSPVCSQILPTFRPCAPCCIWGRKPCFESLPLGPGTGRAYTGGRVAK